MRELRAILDAELHHAHARVRIFGVHVNDRHLESFREIARVVRRAPVAGISRKPDLIIRDDVQRSANAISAEPRHVERLGNHAFSRERCVAVNDDGHYSRFVALALYRQ